MGGKGPPGARSPGPGIASRPEIGAAGRAGGGLQPPACSGQGGAAAAPPPSGAVAAAGAGAGAERGGLHRPVSGAGARGYPGERGAQPPAAAALPPRRRPLQRRGDRHPAPGLASPGAGRRGPRGSLGLGTRLGSPPALRASGCHGPGGCGWGDRRAGHPEHLPPAVGEASALFSAGGGISPSGPTGLGTWGLSPPRS